jgi:Flp pilus assembly protein TadG
MRLHKTCDDRGGTLVEFALVAPLLFLLLFGVIEFARVGHGFNTVWTAAREGARYATTVGDDDSDGLPNYLDCESIEEAALAKVAGMSLDTGAVEIVFFDLTGAAVADCDLASPLPEPSPTGSTHIDSGFTIEVEVSGNFNAIVPLISTFLDGIDVTSSQTRSIFWGVVGE